LLAAGEDDAPAKGVPALVVDQPRPAQQIIQPVEGLDTYILAPRDPADLDLLIEANTPLPDSMIRELNKLRVALVGFADGEADRLCGALERVAGRPRL